MKHLSKNDILSIDDLVVEELEIPEWNGCVFLRALTGEERDAFEAESIIGKGKNKEVNMKNLRARLIARCVVDPVDKKMPMFTKSDVEALGKKSSKALDRIYSKATEMNGLSDDDVERLAKNSPSDQSEGST